MKLQLFIYASILLAVNTVAYSIENKTDSAQKSIEIGDYIAEAGGVVFYKDTLNKLAYIIAMEDVQSQKTAYKSQNNINLNNMVQIADCSKVQGTIGSGLQNTNKLAIQTTNREAAKLCRAYHAAGCDDWYLPSIGEWQFFVNSCRRGAGDKTNLFYTVNHSITKNGGTPLSNTDWYWSSTPRSVSKAWAVSFNEGSIYNLYSFNLFNVRAMRILKY